MADDGIVWELIEGLQDFRLLFRGQPGGLPDSSLQRLRQGRKPLHSVAVDRSLEFGQHARHARDRPGERRNTGKHRRALDAFKDNAGTTSLLNDAVHPWDRKANLTHDCRRTGLFFGHLRRKPVVEELEDEAVAPG